MRWFGSNADKVELSEIAQVPGVKGVVGMIMDIPAGEVWPKERIKALKEEIEAAGLSLKVIESVNIHDDIKIGLPTRDKYIENYKETIRNLAEFGIEVICYNFMPVFDWLKSDLDYRLADNSQTMAFVAEDIPENPQEIIDRVQAADGGFSLPGWEPERLSEVKDLFEAYKNVDEHKLRENFAYFLKAIIPKIGRASCRERV